VLKTKFWFAAVFLAFAAAAPADSLRIAAPPALDAFLTEVVQVLRADPGMQIEASTDNSSSSAIAALGEKKADAAILTRALTGDDRAQYPEMILNPIPLGEQTIALAVPRAIWDGGTHSLTREQMKGIYESKITNWREVGGPNEKITFFNFQEKIGPWELLAQWLYEDVKKTPKGRFQTVETDAESLSALESTPGALVMISPLLVDGQRNFALEIKDANGKASAPTAKNVAAKTYPLTRPLVLVINDRPTLEIKTLVEFLTGPRAEALLKKYGFYSASSVKASE
jgi:phosphate transport system substrate-binding protein